VKFKAAAFLGIEIGILAIALGAIWMSEQTQISLNAINSIAATQQALIPGLCLIVSFYYN
jgi:hypothetical protein